MQEKLLQSNLKRYLKKNKTDFLTFRLRFPFATFDYNFINMFILETRFIRWSLLVLLVAAGRNSYAQSFVGPHISQFDPLKAVYFNPAALPNSEMRWQVNILSADISVGNDFLRVATLKGIFKDFDPYNFFEVNMDGRSKNLNINSDIRGPGFMLNFGKNSIAVGTRIREVASVNDLNEDLAYSLFHHYNDLMSYVPEFKNENTSAAVNAYAEYSVAFARKLIDKKMHEVSVGVNFKILDKIFYSTFNGRNIQFNKYEGVLDRSVNVHQSEFDLIVSDDYEDDKFKHDWRPDGWAIDAGVEYAFKPTKLFGKYLVKVGIALNDFGTLKQQYGANSYHFRGNNKNVPANSLMDEDGNLHSFDQILDSVGTRTPTTGKLKITLPSVMHFYVDVKALPKLYVYAGVQVNPYRFKERVGLANLPSRFTIVPRFEMKRIGLYAPLSWDKYEDFSSGVGFRFAQFSVGSANIISSAIKNDFKGVDIYFSLSIGGKRRTEKI